MLAIKSLKVCEIIDIDTCFSWYTVIDPFLHSCIYIYSCPSINTSGMTPGRPLSVLCDNLFTVLYEKKKKSPTYDSVFAYILKMRILPN